LRDIGAVHQRGKVSEISKCYKWDISWDQPKRRANHWRAGQRRRITARRSGLPAARLVNGQIGGYSSVSLAKNAILINNQLVPKLSGWFLITGND
jgi:hypothetical protein